MHRAPGRGTGRSGWTGTGGGDGRAWRAGGSSWWWGRPGTAGRRQLLPRACKSARRIWLPSYVGWEATGFKVGERHDWIYALK